MALPALPVLFNPIPNNPFYSSPVYTTCGAYYPITVGAGLEIDPITATLSSIGGGGGVNSITAGTGIGVSASVGNIVISNTGVTSIVAGPNIAVNNVGGVVTVTGTKAGTVTSVSTGAGLTGGPITSSGTIALSTTGVTPGGYSYASFTVDAYGRISAASNGAVPVTGVAFLAKGDLLVGTGAGTYAVLPSSGTFGDILCVNPATATGLQWGAHSGILCGYTCSAAPLSTALGFNAATSATGQLNVALGAHAASGLTSGQCNTVLGACALTVPGNSNVAVGYAAGQALTGNCNVVIGPAAAVAVPGNSCQLAIGYGANNWLTGCNTLAIKPGAGVVDCANLCGTANQILTSQGNAIQWKSVSSVLPAPNYGNFLSTLTQTPLAVGVGQPVTLNTTLGANNFSLTNGSQITAAVAGTYNLQFSLQLLLTSGGGDSIEIWVAKNGNPVPNSNTSFSVKNVNEAEFAALNFIDTLNAGDYLQLYWAAGDVHLRLAALASSYGGPNIPSAIVTVVPVGA